ncbi:hypothetical protein ACSFB8_10815 [Enterococcus faecalis]
MTVQGVTSLTAARESSSAPLLYTFEAEADITLKDELPNLLSGFSNVNYKVLKPVKLVVYESEKVREDAYYPVIAG